MRAQRADQVALGGGVGQRRGGRREQAAGDQIGRLSTSSRPARQAPRHARRPREPSLRRAAAPAPSSIGPSQASPPTPRHPDQGRAGERERQQARAGPARIASRAASRRRVAISSGRSDLLHAAPEVVAEQERRLRADEGAAARQVGESASCPASGHSESDRIAPSDAMYGWIEPGGVGAEQRRADAEREEDPDRVPVAEVEVEGRLVGRRREAVEARARAP